MSSTSLLMSTLDPALAAPGFRHQPPSTTYTQSTHLSNKFLIFSNQVLPNSIFVCVPDIFRTNTSLKQKLLTVTTRLAHSKLSIFSDTSDINLCPMAKVFRHLQNGMSLCMVTCNCTPIRLYMVKTRISFVGVGSNPSRFRDHSHSKMDMSAGSLLEINSAVNNRLLLETPT